MDAVAVARVARPYLGRSALALFIALAGLVVAETAGTRSANLVDKLTEGDVTAGDYVAAAGGVVFIVFGLIAIRIFTRGTGKAIEQPLGDARTNTLTLIISVVAHAALLLAALNLLGVPLEGLLLGGAITGVVLGIAAQQTLGNVFAGLVLLIVRPFVVGDEVVLKSGSLGGEYAGRITDMGLFYVDMVTETGPVKLPNAGVLAGAVGPGARSGKETEGEELEEPVTANTSEGGAANGS
jgi:small-conductance mechanosensitive channel